MIKKIREFAEGGTLLAKIRLLHSGNQRFTLSVPPSKNRGLFKGRYTVSYVLIFNILYS